MTGNIVIEIKLRQRQYNTIQKAKCKQSLPSKVFLYAKLNNNTTDRIRILYQKILKISNTGYGEETSFIKAHFKERRGRRKVGMASENETIA